jgi:hypothetical protein
VREKDGGLTEKKGQLETPIAKVMTGWRRVSVPALKTAAPRSADLWRTVVTKLSLPPLVDSDGQWKSFDILFKQAAGSLFWPNVSSSGSRCATSRRQLISSSRRRSLLSRTTRSELGHTLVDKMEIRIGDRLLHYIEPSRIEETTDVSVVFFKMALSGWDCPRAEVMMSFRRAEDHTYIAQLLGRMVRTPLARRIERKSELNDVHLFLPRFDDRAVRDVCSLTC